MHDAQWLAERYEQSRPRLQRIAVRILGSRAESDDALQESWLRIIRLPGQFQSQMPTATTPRTQPVPACVPLPIRACAQRISQCVEHNEFQR